MSKNTKQTSKAVSSLASDVLRNSSSSAIQKLMCAEKTGGFNLVN
ncbi:hypothetical protein ABTJ00_08180 [Acinetobacter baumannii]|nr:hypothetical protein [Acinetobacter baumannii]MCZ2969026.1 hypothetical protein [Acinetobacter baumannii]MCZ3306830.1 hypothetical protein [Acinetobacter baumannii]MDC4425521.1 hypothetical protein [Acinetobacter baumannii]